MEMRERNQPEIIKAMLDEFKNDEPPSDPLVELNEDQRRAVESNHPRILCLAGAGTGKTKTLVTRVARLIEEGVDPDEILMLTFTRAAAIEQKERLVQLVGEDADEVFAGTFHSFAVKMIRQFPYMLGVQSNFSIYDEEDTASLVSTIVEELQYSIKPEDVIEAMEKRAVYGVPIPLGEVSRIVEEYEFRCKNNNAVDFNHLMSGLKTIANGEAGNRYLKAKYKYVFVDEFQDTDKHQMGIIEAFEPENLFVVGDDFQSIYGFRGSDVSIIMGLAENPEWETIKLQDNYRSTEEIVGPANALIKHNPQTEKILYAHSNGPDVTLKEYLYPEDEEAGICRIIEELREKGVPYGEIAILARTNKQVSSMAASLEIEEYPYQVRTRSSDVLNRPDVKRIMDWMSVIINERDDEAVARIVNWPKETLGRLTMQEIEMYKLQNDCSLMTALKASGKADGFCETYDRMKEPGEMYAGVLYETIVRYTRVIAHYDNIGLTSRKYAMEEAFKIICNWEEEMEARGEAPTAEAWLEHYRMRNVGTETMEEPKEDAIQLMTAHGSKGLEFQAVIILGCNDGQFPLTRGDAYEERRLFYVAMTRAKKHLYLTRSMSRELWVGGRLIEATKSRFIYEALGI